MFQDQGFQKLKKFKFAERCRRIRNQPFSVFVGAYFVFTLVTHA